MIDVVLVDENDKVLGYKEKFEAHHRPVPLHRAISVIIFNSTGDKMLLQQRASNKPTWPLFWSNACCTHPYKDESYLDCAERRLKEEMGFETKLVEKFRFVYEADYDITWGEHEYDVVFEGKYDGEIKSDPQEANDWKWMDVGQLYQDIQTNPNIYTPWFKIILQKYTTLDK